MPPEMTTHELLATDGLHLEADVAYGVTCWLCLASLNRDPVGKLLIHQAAHRARTVLADDPIFQKLLRPHDQADLQKARHTAVEAFRWASKKAAEDLKDEAPPEALAAALVTLQSALSRPPVDSEGVGGGPLVVLVQGSGARTTLLNAHRSGPCQPPPVPPASGTPAAVAGGYDPAVMAIAQQALVVLLQIRDAVFQILRQRKP